MLKRCARQSFPGERAQRVVAAHHGRGRCHLRTGCRPDRKAYSLLCSRRRQPRTRPAFRLHSLRFARTEANEAETLASCFIRFGSRVDLYVPKSATITAALGDKVYAT